MVLTHRTTGLSRPLAAPCETESVSKPFSDCDIAPAVRSTDDVFTWPSRKAQRDRKYLTPCDYVTFGITLPCKGNGSSSCSSSCCSSSSSNSSGYRSMVAVVIVVVVIVVAVHSLLLL